jgi:hypothetical protein
MCAVALLVNNTIQYNTIQYNAIQRVSFHSRGPCSGSRQRIVWVLNLVQRRADTADPSCKQQHLLSCGLQ